MANPTTPLVGQTIQFNNLSNNALTYLWNFGDGTTSTLMNPTKIYNAIGNYIVKLTAYNGTTQHIFQTIINISITYVGPPVGGNAICDGSHPTEVVPITSITGRIWMDRNLGASRAATSATDFEAYGGLYQWGRGNDGHASMNWNSAFDGTPINGATTTLAVVDNPGHSLFIKNNGDWRSNNNNTRWQGINGINNPCPSGYRIPTIAEINAEFAAYNITNTASAFNCPLKFVIAGGRFYNDAVLDQTGSYGFYWSSSFGTGGLTSSIKNFDASSVSWYEKYRAYGGCIRCIKN